MRGRTPDHRVGLAVETQVAAHRPRVPSELALPEGVAQEDLLVVARLAFLLEEGPAQDRGHAQEAEIGGGDALRPDAGGKAVLLQAHAAVPHEGLLLEDGGLPEPVEVVGNAGVGAVDRPRLRVVVAHQEDAVGLRHRQGPQDDVVHDREEGGIGADAEGEGQGRRERERLVPGQEPQAHPKVASHSFQNNLLLAETAPSVGENAPQVAMVPQRSRRRPRGLPCRPGRRPPVRKRPARGTGPGGPRPRSRAGHRSRARECGGGRARPIPLPGSCGAVR